MTTPAAPDPAPGAPLRPSRLRNAVTPFSRTGAYYARSWRRYLDRESGGDIPVVRPTLAMAGQAFLDEIVLSGFRVLLPSGDPTLLDRLRRETAAALEMFGDAGWLDDARRYHEAPPALVDPLVRTVRGRHVYERMSFESLYEPHAGEPGRDRWLGYRANNRTRAWLLRHHEPRPWLVCSHATAMGRPGLDMGMFRARWLHEELGLNVVLPVQPLHGPRKHGLPKGAAFPGEDALDNIHGAAHAVWDVRRVLSWIRHEQPGQPIGMTGISLGGYVTSLVASLDDGLVCAILGVPAVDLIDLVDHHSGLSPMGPHREVMEVAKQVGRVVSPLALTPLVPAEGRFMYAGLADRLVHPRHQITRLWEHWGRPQITWYEGAHVGFARSTPVWRFTAEALRRSGLIG